MLTAREIGWAAGFLEGDGSFKLSRKSPVIAGHQASLEPLERLQRLFGGQIHKRTTNSVGRLGTLQMWDWTCNGLLAASVMMTLYCEMSRRRREQIGKCLAAWRTAKLYQRYITACPKGHPYDEKNTYRHTNGGRCCRTCVKEATQRWRYKKRLAWALLSA